MLNQNYPSTLPPAEPRGPTRPWPRTGLPFKAAASHQKPPHPRPCLNRFTRGTKSGGRSGLRRRGEGRSARPGPRSNSRRTQTRLPASPEPAAAPAEGARGPALTGTRSARRSTCLSSRSACGPSCQRRSGAEGSHGAGGAGGAGAANQPSASGRGNDSTATNRRQAERSRFESDSPPLIGGDADQSPFVQNAGRRSRLPTYRHRHSATLTPRISHSEACCEVTRGKK